MNRPENFAKRSNLQITLREMQKLLAAPRFWIALACVVALLVVSGPFETSTLLTTPQRAAYWAAVSLATYFLAMAFIVPFTLFGEAKGWPKLLTAILGGCVAGPAVGVLVYGINTQIAGYEAGALGDLIYILCACTVITVAVSCLVQLVAGTSSQAEPVDPTAPRFMKRLSVDVRGDVMTLNAQDHYVEVVTSRGKELILMRLGDAIDELPGIDGQRIHRSWWVSKEAISTLAPYRGKLFLDLKDGRTIPVSRSNEKMVMDWLR